MNDRELLELAAKAAGYLLAPMTQKYGNRDEPIVVRGFGLLTPDGQDWQDYPHFWNPLTDDGDALRLAVKLNLNVDLAYGDECIVRVFNEMHFFSERTDKDLYAATRRAIVRAAAEIGKAMP